MHRTCSKKGGRRTRRNKKAEGSRIKGDQHARDVKDVTTSQTHRRPHEVVKDNAARAATRGQPSNMAMPLTVAMVAEYCVCRDSSYL